MPDPATPLVIGLGEVLWDCFADSRRPGGAPANVAFQANQLGCQGIVCSRVGTDPLGDELAAFLAGQGLSTEGLQRDSIHRTGTVTVDTSRPDHPSYVIHEDVAWDNLEFTPAWQSLASRAAAVCFGTLAQRQAVSRETIHRTLEAAGPQCLVVYDVNLRQHWYARSWIERSLARSQIVKLNRDEVQVLADLLNLGSADEESFARAVLQRYPVQAVCVTRAEQGCLLVDRNGVAEAAGVRVEVADAVGAGDAFTAAMIVARLRAWPLEAQAAFANRVGALVASRAGAMPCLRDELADLVRQYESGKAG